MPHHEPFVLKSTNQVVGARIMPATAAAADADLPLHSLCAATGTIKCRKALIHPLSLPASSWGQHQGKERRSKRRRDK
jgi:hypothetical protein